MKKIILALLLVFGISSYAKENITVYSYHNHAPFITGKNEGLSHKLIDYLNNNLENYNFTLKIISRSRLNYILKPWINKECETKPCDSKWLVLWVNHKWGFGKDSLDNFSWTPLLNDSNAIISSSQTKFEYTKPSDLINKKLAGISGHKYVGIDDLVKEGKIKRINGNNEVDNLKVVYANRVDVTLLPKSAFNYYKSKNEKFESLYSSKIPHQEYMRNIMTNNKNQKLTEQLSKLDFSKVVQ